MAENTVVEKSTWANLGVHTVTLPSGAVVKVRIPNIVAIVKSELLPDDLRQVALKEITKELELARGDTTDDAPEKTAEVRVDELEDVNRLYEHICAIALIEPELSPAELADPNTRPPEEDLEMLAEIVTRRRYRDAKGVRLGVEPLDAWEPFRRLHGCAEGCDACRQAQNELSTVHAGVV